MEKLDRERLQEYITKLESLRGLLSACAEEAEECMSFAPVQACESMLRDILTNIREKSQSVQEAIEYWQYQLEEG
ncbi:MAG: hypothetical protein NZ526_07645 [Aquificaceae bacterium]|nr:hypothetical protein [Aquificaceae bacterium]